MLEDIHRGYDVEFLIIKRKGVGVSYSVIDSAGNVVFLGDLKAIFRKVDPTDPMLSESKSIRQDSGAAANIKHRYRIGKTVGDLFDDPGSAKSVFGSEERSGMIRASKP